MTRVAHILVIEDEEMLRTSTVRGLDKLLGVEVVGAGTLGEAIESIDRRKPDLILSDLDLPDRSGIELIGELAAREMRVPVVFISAYLAAFRSQIPPHSAVRVLEKPVPLDELRQVVVDIVGAPGASDSASPFGLVDYVQLAGMGGHSVRVETETVSGGSGEVVVHRGEVWAAEDADGFGRDALIRLVNEKASRVECRASRDDPGPRNIEGRWEELLLQAARQADESGAGGDEGGTDIDIDIEFDRALGLETPTADAGQTPTAFSEATEKGLEALLVKDYEAALASFLEAAAIRPDDRTIEANLARLRDMGIGESEDA